jgi:nuclear migration protein JNM1
MQLSTISSRLSALETLLGLPLSQSSTPILPTLTHLNSKLNLLTSQSQIDQLAQRIKTLTTELTKLEEKREQARQRALLDPEDIQPNTALEEDFESTHKIDALYAALATIDRIAPVVPGVLDRLRAMRIVHADAAGVTSGLKDAAARLGRMEGEIKEWKESIGKVEGGLNAIVGRIGGVAGRVEEVILGLEGRVKKLEI